MSEGSSKDREAPKLLPEDSYTQCKEYPLFHYITQENFEQFRHHIFHKDITKKQNPTTRNSYRQTLAHLLARYKGQHALVLASLLDHNKVQREVKSLTGRTALHAAAVYGNGLSIGIICYSMSYEKRARLLNCKDIYGNTALHEAVKFAKKEAVLALMSHGAEMRLQNHFGQSVINIDGPLRELLINFDSLDTCEQVELLREKTSVMSKNEFAAAVSVRRYGLSLPQCFLLKRLFSTVRYVVCELNDQQSFFEICEADSFDKDEYENLMDNFKYNFALMEQLENRRVTAVAYFNDSAILATKLRDLSERRMQFLFDQNFKEGDAAYAGEQLRDTLLKVVLDTIEMIQLIEKKKILHPLARSAENELLREDVDIMLAGIYYPLKYIRERLIYSYVLTKFRKQEIHQINILLIEQSTLIGIDYKRYLCGKNSNNQNLLHLLVTKNDTRLISTVLVNLTYAEKVLLINQQTLDKHYTPLHTAMLKFHPHFTMSIVKMLLRHGVIFCLPDNAKQSPIELFRSINHTKTLSDIVDLLRNISRLFKLVESSSNKFIKSTEYKLLKKWAFRNRNPDLVLSCLLCKNADGFTLEERMVANNYYEVIVRNIRDWVTVAKRSYVAESRIRKN